MAARQIKPVDAVIPILVIGEGGLETIQAPVQLVGHLAVRKDDGAIVHVKTGRGVVSGGGIALAQHLNREVRWTWLDEQPFGPVVTGRGATMVKKAIAEAIASYRSSAD